MKVNRVFLAATVAAISAVAVSSCAYDPYYSGSSYSSGPSYASGYGSGYGYGGRNFSTTYFVNTGNSRWGYDPYARCYYDYSRRSYYDPYLNGYYPVGYRPNYVYGAPHPHGWRSGNRYIAPPSRVLDHRLSNYSNRTERYRSLNTDWSHNIKSTSPSQSYDFNRDRYSSQYQSNATRSSSFFGSNQQNPSSRSYDRSENSYVTDKQDRSRPELRMAQPIQPSPRASRSEGINREERSSRQNRENHSNRERGGSRTEIENPEAMRQPLNRDSNRLRTSDDHRSDPPANRISEGVDERIARRR